MAHRWGRLVALVGYVGVVTGWAVWIAWMPARLDAGHVGPVLAVSAAMTYRAAGFVCHQHESRAFHAGTWAWPVCARCSGLYGGGALGALAVAVAVAVRRRRTAVATFGAVRAGLVAAALPTAASWLAEHGVGMAVPMTWRAVAAVPLGAAVSALLAFLLVGGSVAEKRVSGVH